MSLRRQVQARVRALPPAVLRHAGEEIARRVWTLPEVAAARSVLLYSALAGEVPTLEIAAEARRRGIAVVYPRCLPEGRLALHRVDAEDALLRGRYGIREPDPACAPEAGVAEVEVALVPGLAWDRRGQRLGRGAGYYDRLFALPDWSGWRCGLFFAAREVPRVPADPWDVPLDAVVTEREVWRR